MDTAKKVDAILMTQTQQLKSAMQDYTELLGAIERGAKRALEDAARGPEYAGDCSNVVSYALNLTRSGHSIRPLREALAATLRIRAEMQGEGLPGVVEAARAALASN
jgi:hypothetical protein